MQRFTQVFQYQRAASQEPLKLPWPVGSVKQKFSGLLDKQKLVAQHLVDDPDELVRLQSL